MFAIQQQANGSQTNVSSIRNVKLVILEHRIANLLRLFPLCHTQYKYVDVFLNLPIWANFVDLTDLSLYLPTTTYFRPANIILQPQQPQPRLDKQRGLRTVEA